MMMRDFSELPGDVLGGIAEKLLTLSDLVWFGLVWFGAVCVSWRLASMENPKHCKLLSLLPVLLLPSPSPSTDDDDENTDLNQQIEDDDENDNENPPTEVKRKTNTITRSLYSLYDGKVYDSQLSVGGDCRSSSHGWLVVTTEADQNYSSDICSSAATDYFPEDFNIPRVDDPVT